MIEQDRPTEWKAGDMPTRKAEAQWRGDIRRGDGTIKLESGLYVGMYSFGTRFEDAPGTNPEELLAGSHAGCFSMALSLTLGKAGYTPRAITTTARVTIESAGESFQITSIRVGCHCGRARRFGGRLREIRGHREKRMPCLESVGRNKDNAAGAARFARLSCYDASC